MVLGALILSDGFLLAMILRDGFLLAKILRDWSLEIVILQYLRGSGFMEYIFPILSEAVCPNIIVNT